MAFALAVQDAGIGLRHIKPRRPEQNGKVERSHHTGGKIGDVSLATDPIITEHAMHTFGGRCLTSHYTANEIS
ncbi:MAG: hypothetical protein DYH03_20930 [Nitrospira sp. NTP1]|nr:hypothetical protein [Nitrospira sp. NTP1]